MNWRLLGEVTGVTLAVVAYGLIGSLLSFAAWTFVHPALGVTVFFIYIIGSMYVVESRR